MVGVGPGSDCSGAAEGWVWAQQWPVWAQGATEEATVANVGAAVAGVGAAVAGVGAAVAGMGPCEGPAARKRQWRVWAQVKSVRPSAARVTDVGTALHNSRCQAPAAKYDTD